MRSKALAIPKDSVLPMFSLLFDVLMFMTFIVYIQYANGSMGMAFTTPASGQNGLYIFFSFLGISVPILMFLFTIVYAKKDVKRLIIPLMITPISYVLYELFSFVNGDALFVARQWYKIASSFLVLFLFFFTINKPKISSKFPLVITCTSLILISTVMTLAGIGPFIEKVSSFFAQNQYYEETTILYLSALLQHISYLASILFLGLALAPGGVARRKESRKFFLLKNMDKIHNMSHVNNEPK